MKLKDLVVEMEKSHITNFLTPHEMIVLEAAIMREQMKHIRIDETGKLILDEGMMDVFSSSMSKVYGLADTILKGGGLIGQFARGLVNLKDIGGALLTYIKSNHTPADVATFSTTWQQIKPDASSIYEFLMNLDIVTLHAVTLPMHLIKAVTGIDIEKIIEHKLAQHGIVSDAGFGLVGKLYELAKQIKAQVRQHIQGDDQEKVLSAVNNLAAALPGPTPTEFHAI